MSANMNSKNISVYKGQFQTGKKEGIGIEQTRQHLYEGQWSQDQKHGYGLLRMFRFKKKNKD